MAALEDYDDFMGEVLQQLFTNRENHEDHKEEDLDYMFKIGAEQFGQLGKAMADENWKEANKEVSHVTAIMFELFERIRVKENEEEKGAVQTEPDSDESSASV